MSATKTAVQNVGTGDNVRFGDEQFLANARAYNAHRKGVDWLVGVKPADRQTAIAEMLATIDALELQSVNGAGYTPAATLGFGSGNAATIADQILRRSATTAQTCSKFSALGKPVKA